MVVRLARKFNGIMFLFAIIGGIFGFFVGEIVLSQLLYKIPESLVMGIYFGQFAFFVGLMCLLSEIISPRLNGMNWRRMYAGYSWKVLLPFTLVGLFLLGTLLQYI
jgi:Ca-activated chloride channel family protein